MYHLSDHPEDVSKITGAVRKFLEKIVDEVKEELGIRSPSKDAKGEYDCERCVYHDDCVCVICEEGKTVVCTVLYKHVSRWGTCKQFKPLPKD